MLVRRNRGFDSSVIAEYKAKIAITGRNYLPDEKDKSTDESAHFYFVGKYHGKETVFDALMYTLRLQHESELFEEAEHLAAKTFPKYKRITYEEDENGNLELLDNEEEEIGLFMAEVIMELEEDESIKVKEHVDVDDHAEFGIALDIGLQVEKITPRVIDKFIHDFNSGELDLNPTLYCFQSKGQEAH
jgi:hypothetical protein